MVTVKDEATQEMEMREEMCGTWGLAFMSGFMAAKGIDDAGPETEAWRKVEKEGLAAMRAKPFWGEDNVAGYVRAKAKIVMPEQDLLTIDPVTKERWQWVRYRAETVHLNEPNGRYVCAHLKPNEKPLKQMQACMADNDKEQVVEDLAEIASGDPSALDCHYTIRLCAACAEIYEANVKGRA